MTTVATSLMDFVRSFVDETRTRLVDSGVHPQAQQFIHEWCGDMFRAAHIGDGNAVKYLAAKINKKIADEVDWYEHCLASARRGCCG